jgi:hypothetical protein
MCVDYAWRVFVGFEVGGCESADGDGMFSSLEDEHFTTVAEGREVFILIEEEGSVLFFFADGVCCVCSELHDVFLRKTNLSSR